MANFVYRNKYIWSVAAKFWINTTNLKKKENSLCVNNKLKFSKFMYKNYKTTEQRNWHNFQNKNKIDICKNKKKN